MIIGAIMALVVWFVALMKPQICSESPSMPFLSSDGSVPYRSDQVMVRGAAYNYDQVKLKLESLNVSNFTADFINRDISRVFRERVDPCQEFSKSPESICKVRNKIPGSPDFEPGCLDISILDSIPSQTLTFEWEQLTETRGSLLVFDSYVMNLTEFFSSDYISDFKAPVGLHPIFPVGADITHASAKDFDKLKFAHCLQSKYSIGKIGSASLGCSVYAALSVSALVAVMGVILIRFIMAFAFHWIMASKLVSNKRTSKPKPNNEVGYLKMPLKDVAFFSQKDDPADTGPIYQKIFDRSYSLPTDLYTICMVTCYSEDEISIRSTLDSIAGTSYPDDKKLLFVICDGLIQGAGNSQTTPDIVVSLITQEPQFSSAPAPMSYLAIADGVKQHNMAQVYAGKYFYRQKPVPIIVVVKCGTEQERAPSAHKTKPGNRGKRDSQLILMHFLSRVTFDDRMTALDYDLFRKIQVVTNGVTADKYELLLMVDADTVVKHDSLRFMVQSMVNDDQIMGLCGETRIANKMQSWVTMIQVYEYFTNHNLGKSFESMFGGVTCLPGILIDMTFRMFLYV